MMKTDSIFAITFAILRYVKNSMPEDEDEVITVRQIADAAKVSDRRVVEFFTYLHSMQPIRQTDYVSDWNLLSLLLTYVEVLHVDIRRNQFVLKVRR